MAPTAVEWVAEAAHGYRIVGPWADHAEFLGPRDGERNSDRARKVRRDGRGLRNDVQVMASEHLVPPTRDWFLDGRHQAEQHVAQRVSTADLGGAGQEETAGAIVQQRRIGGTKRGRDRSVALMPG